MSMNKSTLRRAGRMTGAPGTRTAPSWATSGRSTSGSPSRIAATTRRAWISSRRRLDHIVADRHRGSDLRLVRGAGGCRGGRRDSGIVRPIFEPGDVLMFDELCLHSTALDPAMTKTRYAVESWFFGPSGLSLPTTCRSPSDRDGARSRHRGARVARAPADRVLRRPLRQTRREKRAPAGTRQRSALLSDRPR